jgi:hypothetical protein
MRISLQNCDKESSWKVVTCKTKGMTIYHQNESSVDATSSGCAQWEAAVLTPSNFRFSMHCKP